MLSSKAEVRCCYPLKDEDRSAPPGGLPAQACRGVFAHQLNQLTKKPYATIYDNLKTAFGVPKYGDISESEWDKVVNWFKVQMEQAKKKQ